MTLRELLKDKKFAPNAKVNGLLNKSLSTDLDIAKATLTTKVYKEDAAVKKKVDAIIAGEIEEAPKVAEAKKSTSDRGGERRNGR